MCNYSEEYIHALIFPTKVKPTGQQSQQQENRVSVLCFTPWHIGNYMWVLLKKWIISGRTPWTHTHSRDPHFITKGHNYHADSIIFKRRFIKWCTTFNQWQRNMKGNLQQRSLFFSVLGQIVFLECIISVVILSIILFFWRVKRL